MYHILFLERYYLSRWEYFALSRCYETNATSVGLTTTANGLNPTIVHDRHPSIGTHHGGITTSSPGTKPRSEERTRSEIA
jgi:hypothetical protein